MLHKHYLFSNFYRMKTTLTILLSLFVSCAFAQQTKEDLAEKVVAFLKSGEYAKMSELLPSDEFLNEYVAAQSSNAGMPADKMKEQLKAMTDVISKTAENLANKINESCGMESIEIQETNVIMREGQPMGFLMIKVSCKESWKSIPIGVTNQGDGLAFMGIAQ